MTSGWTDGRPPGVMPVHRSTAGPDGHPSGPGPLAVVTAALVTVVGAVLFIGVVAVVLALTLVALLVALVVVAVHRMLVALSPSYRRRRETLGPMRPTATVIETTARLIDTAKPKRTR
jgi:Flp pilus assembly protein TadB